MPISDALAAREDPVRISNVTLDEHVCIALHLHQKHQLEFAKLAANDEVWLFWRGEAGDYAAELTLRGRIYVLDYVNYCNNLGTSVYKRKYRPRRSRAKATRSPSTKR